MTSRRLNVGIVFGSRSAEHEVSIVTAMQVFENIDRVKYNVIPIYIDKNLRWWTGKKIEKLESFRDLKLITTRGLTECYLSSHRIKALTCFSKNPFKKFIPLDIIFPTIHGTFGEDGTLQGLLEMYQIPYVGSGVTGSAVGMDKIIQKAVFEKEGLPVVKYCWFTKRQWITDKNSILKDIEKQISYPIFVKPANLGSSVGITKAKGRKSLIQAIEIAKEFDQRIIVEQGLENIIEINCSVLGNRTLKVSVCEQPIRSKDFLSYDDKYLKGGKIKGMAGLSRLVPAPISKELTRKIQDLSLKAFRATDTAGISRIDFLVTKSKKVFICEINTLPGSLAFYLWEKSGISFTNLIDELIKLGFEKFEERKENLSTYDSKLIDSLGGGAKL